VEQGQEQKSKVSQLLMRRLDKQIRERRKKSSLEHLQGKPSEKADKQLLWHRAAGRRDKERRRK
jgi:hypothetical protein